MSTSSYTILPSPLNSSINIITLSLSQPSNVSNTTSCQIYTYGAHVTKFTSSKNEITSSYLYLSESAILDGTKAIRGGIPICWPQFSNRGKLNAHGFARTSLWKIKEVRTNDDNIVCRLILSEPNKDWNYEYELEYEVILTWNENSSNPNLTCNFHVSNRSDKSFTFTIALHSYYTFPIENVSMSPLENLEVQDNLTNTTSISDYKSLIFPYEIDRVYIDAFKKSTLSIISPSHTLRITCNNLPDAVIWNPWKAKADKMNDLDKDGWKHFVCCEPGAIVNPINLDSGKTWSSSMKVEIEDKLSSSL